MTRLRWLQTNSLSSRLLITGVLGLSFIFSSTALAQFVPPSHPTQPSRPQTPDGSGGTRFSAGGTRYVPPSHPSRPSRPVGSTGTRGSCGKATGTSLTALAPVSYNGQTVSAHPTFVWYVSEQDTSWAEFTLYELDAKGGYKRLYKTQLESTKNRVRTFTLPKDVPGLSEQQTYLWQVALLCDSSNPSKDKLAKAMIEVVATPPSLKVALAQTFDPLKRAALYAQVGLWYDALAEALAAGSGTQSVWLDLVEDLSRLEASSSGVDTHKQGEQLQKIVSLEKPSMGGAFTPARGAGGAR